MTLPIVFHPEYAAPLRRGHPFPMSKYGYLRGALVARGLLPASGGFVAPAPLPPARAAAVHSLAYVERVANVALTPEEERRIGLPNTPAVARRAFLAAAGTLLAARLALEHGLACNMAGGSHHAGPEGGAGYCVLNDVAIAARALIDEGRVRRVLVVDCDVHQGDGTALIFASDPDVLTLSLHAERNYPARKAASHLDYPLPDRLADRPYLEVLDEALSGQPELRPCPGLLQRRGRSPRRRPARPAGAERRRAPGAGSPGALVGAAAPPAGRCRARRRLRQRPGPAGGAARDPVRGGCASPGGRRCRRVSWRPIRGG